MSLTKSLILFGIVGFISATVIFNLEINKDRALYYNGCKVQLLNDTNGNFTTLITEDGERIIININQYYIKRTLYSNIIMEVRYGH